MATKKYLDQTGLAEVAGYVNSRLKTVTTMPVTAKNKAVRLYVGEDTANYLKGHTYEASTTGYFAWRYESAPGVFSTYYTLSATPEVGDDVYSYLDDEFEVAGQVEAVGTDEITFASHTFSRYTNGDITATTWTDITVTGLKVVDQMPLTAKNDETVLYIGPQINGYVPGTIYKFDAQQSVVVNITTSASAGSMFNNHGFFQANDIDNLPSTVDSWTLNSVDNPELLKQWISNQEPVLVKTGVLVVGVMETTDPMAIGSDFWALVAYNTMASEVETLDVTLTSGSNSWINLTKIAVDDATSELSSLIAEKADKFQYSGLPSPSEQFEGKLLQNTNNSGFYACVPKGEQTVITTASQLSEYVQDNGSPITVVQSPFANTTNSMLIDGYQYYYDNFTSAFVRIQTDTFLTRVNSQWIPAVTDEEAAELDISYYPEGYEWKLVNAQIHLNPELAVEFLQSIPATEFDTLNFPDGEFDYQLGFFDNNGTLVYKVWDASQSYWRDIGSIDDGVYDDYGYCYIDVETVIGIKTAYNTTTDEEAREVAAGAMALAQQAYEAATYEEPQITSFTMNVDDTYEIGSTVNSITFNWAYNKDITSQTLTDCTLASASVRTATYDTPLSSNKTFTLTASDGKNSVSASKSVSFKHKVYWGAASEPSEFTSAFILALTGKKFATNYKGSYNMNLGEGQYGYLAYPASWGTVSAWWIGGFEVETYDCGTIEFTNASGNTTTFRITRTTQPSLGSITAEVK